MPESDTWKCLKCGDVIFSRIQIQKFAPDEPGVYVGYNETKEGNLRVTYVGQAKNLRKRLRHHEKGCTHFSFEIINTGDIHEGTAENRMDARKKELIGRYHPHLNIRGKKKIKEWEENL